MKLAVAYPAEEVLDDHPGFGLLEVDVASLTSRGCRVVFTPSEGRGHVSVYGLKGGNQIKRMREAICGELLRVWEPVNQKLVYPPPSAQ
jgi:hypothetical protein